MKTNDSTLHLVFTGVYCPLLDNTGMQYNHCDYLTSFVLALKIFHRPFHMKIKENVSGVCNF